MDTERDPDLTSFVEGLADEFSTPGVSVGVLVNGRAIAAPVGVTSTSDPLPVDEDTLFMVGSTSKTFTATALMAHVDQGTLAVDDRVVDHMPAFRLQDEQVAKTVTIGHLLNHTGGWRGDMKPLPDWGEDALERALDAVAAAPQELPLGHLASYNNSGFLIAGHILATVHGTSYEQAIQDLVADPLGMANTFSTPWDIANRRHAVGHIIPAEGKATPVMPYLTGRATGPAGGVWSSMTDLLTYARYHLDGTTDQSAPLSEQSRLAMQQPTVEARSTIDGIGLSWLLNHYGDVRLVSHGGNVSNLQTSTFVLAPDPDFAVTVMTNTKHGATIGAKVQAWALQHYLGIGPPPALATEAFDAAELAGIYDLGPFAYALTAEAKKAYIKTVVPDDVAEEIRVAFDSPPRELAALGPDVFTLADDPVGPVLDVRRGIDASIDGIVFGMRFARRRP